MKVLQIIDSLSMGGAENVLISLSIGLKQLGHEVTIMPLVCPAKTPVREKIENAGIIVTPFKDRGSVYNPLLVFKIARELKYYDVIHVHLFPALYWAAIARFMTFGKKCMIYTEHSTNNKRRENPLLHSLDKVVYKYGYKRIVACAEKVLETYKESFPSIKHVCFINNGVNTQQFRIANPYTKRELLGLSEDSFVVTMVARFMPMKRQDTIVRAISKLPNNIHAVFVGGNPEDEGLMAVKDLAMEEGVINRVHFLYIRTDVPRILKTSDIIVMASDYEGLSLSSIEGMAAGKPFIATNVNGLREVVEGAGVLFENGNEEQLATIINKLTIDKVYYKKVSESCIIRAKDFDVNGMVLAYDKVYKDVII